MKDNGHNKNILWEYNSNKIKYKYTKREHIIIMKPSTNETPSQTYKMTELGVLPEEWKVVPLDNKYIEFQNGLWKGKKEPYIKVRVLRNTNFKNDGTIDFEDVAELDVEQRNFKNREIIKDDIILERSGGGPTQPVGRVVFFEREDQFMYSFSNFTSRIRISDKLIIFPKFLFYFLLDFYNQGKTNDIQNRTTGIRNLDFSRYKQIPIPLPPLPEQQKIAAVLSAVQEAKEKTEAVIAAAKALKKSMMKHLFTYGPVSPEETETVPLKETEIGPMPKDWEVVRLGDVVIKNKGIQRGPWGGSIKKEIFVSVGYAVYEQGNVISGNITDFRYFIDKDKFEELKNFEVKAGDILITAAGTLGKLVILPNKIHEGVINQALIRIRIDEQIINKIYFRYLFNLIVEQGIIDSYSHGATLKNLSSIRVLRNIRIPLPPLPTQQKIASILSAIDAKIEAEENKKKALEELFKSLLHNLMTAKIRVNHLGVTL